MTGNSPIADTNARLIQLPYHQDILQSISELVATRFSDVLPDLSDLTILVAQGQAIPDLRRQLLNAAQQAGHEALLGPHVYTFHHWVGQQHLPPSHSDTRIFADHTRELLLVEALKEFPGVYNHCNPWLLAASLIPLFDDLTRQHVALPDSLDDFIEQLGQAYGLADTSQALGMEATLVHTLWQAMQQELQSRNAIDEATAHILRLHYSLNTINPQQRFIVAGLFDFTPADIQWLNTLLEREQITVQTQADAMAHEAPTDEVSVLPVIPSWHAHIHDTFTRLGDPSSQAAFFHAVYDFTDHHLLNRAAAFKQAHPESPVDACLSEFAATNTEDEARAVELQIRQWLLEGRRHLAIVTENRRLARRVRALLERANVVLHDAAGWALSTTSAATVIERWLECIEQDFHHHSLLDFLKSPFVFTGEQRDAHLATVFRFERDVVLNENVAGNLERYRKHAGFRLNRMQEYKRDYYDSVLQLLDNIEAAATPLLALLDDKHHPACDYLDALENGLTVLGVWQHLSEDAAGQQILEQIRFMTHAADVVPLNMHWMDFRTWLGQTLEGANFVPEAEQYHVQLLSLSQTDGQRFDGLVIASAEAEHLPGVPTPSPFFNDAVRHALGIPPGHHQTDVRYRLFRRLLESCITHNNGRILFTRRASDNDEDIIASPWLEAMLAFHGLAYGNDLSNHSLAGLLQQPESVVQTDDRPLPSPTPANPAASIPAALAPTAVSASGYQQLMDCPFQFFAARCLQLKAPDYVREQMEKDDYGNRVHRCLEAFHSDLPGLDGPFAGEITEDNRHDAIALLQKISHQVFSRDIEDNFLHRGWLKQWLAVIPHYIQWQLEHNQHWKTYAAEQRITNVTLNEQVQLNGVLDRIDRRDTGFGIIDYKTGKVPKQDEIDSGEAIQLPYYAILAESGLATEKANTDIGRVEYVSLVADGRKMANQPFLENETLAGLSRDVKTRLTEVMQSIHEGNKLTAWGDAKVCRYCQFDGLCRLQLWEGVLNPNDVADKTRN